MEIIPQQQNNTQDLTAEEAKASMGVATYLMETLMPKGMPEAPQTQEFAPGQEESQPVEQMEQQPEQDMGKEFDNFKGEVKGMIDAKFDDLTKMLKEALNDDEEI